jgi:hypothetical protein
MKETKAEGRRRLNPSPVYGQSGLMHLCVAFRAECDQVFLRVIARLTAELFVVNFEIRHPTT